MVAVINCWQMQGERTRPTTRLAPMKFRRWLQPMKRTLLGLSTHKTRQEQTRRDTHTHHTPERNVQRNGSEGKGFFYSPMSWYRRRGWSDPRRCHDVKVFSPFSFLSFSFSSWAAYKKKVKKKRSGLLTHIYSIPPLLHVRRQDTQMWLLLLINSSLFFLNGIKIN